MQSQTSTWFPSHNPGLWPFAVALVEVLAKRCKGFANSTFHELGQHLEPRSRQNLKRAAEVSHIRNAERDLHCLFQGEQMCLPIRATTAEIGSQTVHYLSLKTWFPFLLEQHPHFVLGGYSTKEFNARLLLSTFWTNFEKNFPDHEVFQIHKEGPGDDRFHRCIPFLLHLDEGVGLRKSAVLVHSMQPVLGRETARKFAENFEEKDIHARMTQSQFHNSTGTTLCSRFLFTALPKKMYTGTNVDTYRAVLDILGKESKELMVNGIEVNGEVWFPVCLGVKGDQPALIKSGNFKRSYMNMGRNRGCCWECLAGFDGYNFEDTTPNASWIPTIGLSNPWPQNAPSPLLQVPSYSANPVLFWRRDPFHAFKQTIGGHFAASLIVLFACDVGLWKADGLSSAVDEMLARAFYDFAFWVKHEWRGFVVNHIKAFTRQILHFKDQLAFPFARFKGSDQMILLRWLRHLVLHGPVFETDVCRGDVCLINNPPPGWRSEFFWYAYTGCDGAIQFFHSLHREGVWLQEAVARGMAENCQTFCCSYRRLAMLCHLQGLARFHLEPSLHTFYHFKMDLSPNQSSPGSVKLSPATSTTEADEDFVGRICRLCRAVHAQTCTKRCIERYLIRCHFEFEKYK